ncbi:MAG: hypothetical protein QNK24_08885 [Desulfuromusa sp.]|nr:hypothetical protein [Desulfuromusa sp.]
MTVENIPVYPSEQYLLTFTSGDSLNFTLLRGLQQLKKAVALMPLPEGYELAYTHRVFGF